VRERKNSAEKCGIDIKIFKDIENVGDRE